MNADTRASKKGFTLIEIVLAIAVGLIIIAGVSVGYSYAKRAAIADSQRKEPAASASSSLSTTVSSATSTPLSTPKKTPPSPQAKGTLQGQMTIGPICPVEQASHPCEPTAETYAAHPVYVYQSDRKTLLFTLTPDAKGEFKITLPPGDYWVDVAHQSVGSVRGAPAPIRINSGAAAKIAITIDTGIR